MMHIALASDDNYAQHMAVTIASVIENNRNEEIIFHIMDNGISEQSIKKIKKQIEKYNQKAYFYDFSNFEDEVGFKAHSTVLPMSAFSRIFLPTRLKCNVERLIYLDVDVVCNGSLHDIYNSDLGNCTVGAVQDFADNQSRKSSGVDKVFRYVNTGFLLIDLVKWNNENLTNRIHQYILERKGKTVQGDQGPINAVVREQIKILHPRYNVMSPFFFMGSKAIKEWFEIPIYYSDKDILEAKKNPVIIHYLKFNGLMNRPWEENCIHPLRYKYRYYLEHTEWAGTKLSPDKRSFVQRMKCNYHLRCPWKIKKIVTKVRRG